MKGMVFTEFLEMVEGRYGLETADEIVETSRLPSGGSYTAVGTYDHQELVALIMALSSKTGIPIPDLIQSFGKHLFGRFLALYPQFFVGIQSAFDFVMTIDGRIHAEVRKLYPDAELPQFDAQRIGQDQLELIYRSSRPFADLAHGLLIGCGEHFGEAFVIEREEIAGDHRKAIRFLLTRKVGVHAWTKSSS